ncbi:hypothetical protein BHM03_00051744 [Ensete ventricosum]|uniref:Uncharacterized protein n=1 Tax=Ensete ventricosum TaxID=4639 RepID=A0A445MM14_ENSVE|nr:hypothetical protein BHM03_00051744 [Ensete ventricosum]
MEEKTCGRPEAKAWTEEESELVARVRRTRHDTREMCTRRSPIANAGPAVLADASSRQSRIHAPSKWTWDPRARQCDGVAHVTAIGKRRQQRGSAPPLCRR